VTTRALVVGVLAPDAGEGDAEAMLAAGADVIDSVDGDADVVSSVAEMAAAVVGGSRVLRVSDASAARAARHVADVVAGILEAA
jgi:hypothetical protein